MAVLLPQVQVVVVERRVEEEVVALVVVLGGSRPVSSMEAHPDSL